MQMGPPKSTGGPSLHGGWWCSILVIKETRVSNSLDDAEYVAMTHAAKEVLWLRALFGEVFQMINKPTVRRTHDWRHN